MDITPFFTVISRYGSGRSFSLLYADKSHTAWELHASDAKFYRCSTGANGGIEYVDFDGGPDFKLGQNLFGFGIISKILLTDHLDEKASIRVTMLLNNIDAASAGV
jgi:hypothetical protein